MEQVDDDPALASNRLLWDTMLKSGIRAMIEFQVRSDKSVDAITIACVRDFVFQQFCYSDL
jgi:hypothetical protein